MSDIEEESFFPKDLLSKAELQPESNELLWRLPDMDAVINTLEQNRKVILGLDIFSSESGILEVIGYSNFSRELKSIRDHEVRLRKSAKMARDRLRKQENFDQLRITITWDSV